jgi:hypothetical protein
MRIHRVALAAVAGGEHPDLRGQLGRHVEHHLPVMHQPVRQVPPDSVAPLHRPDPIAETVADRREHRGIAGLVGAITAQVNEPAVPSVDHLDRRRALVRIHPDNHTHRRLPSFSGDMQKQGGHRYFEQNRPLSSHSLHGARRGRKPDESHTNTTGRQPLIKSDPPNTWTESGRTPVLRPIL